MFLSWDYSTRKDNFTDMLMLEKAAYIEMENPFEAALLIPSPRYKTHPETIDRLEQVINSEPGDLPQNTYARYWHGYLVILKPMLLLFSPAQIYLINLIMLLVTIILIAIKFSRRTNLLNATIFVLTLVFMNPVMVACNFQFMTSTMVCLGIIAVLLWKWDKIQSERNFGRLFFLSGILTSFLDLLTYPLITLGLPLLMCILMLCQRNRFKSPTESLKFCIVQSMWWMLGYGGMWASKWVIASLFTQENVILDAFNSVGIRTGSITSGVTSLLGRMEGLMKNVFDCIVNSGFFVTLGSLLTLLIVLKIRGLPQNYYLKTNLVNEENRKALFWSCLLIACYPLVWTLCLNNHTAIHHWFTWRMFSISLFTCLILLVFYLCNSGLFTKRQKQT